MDYWCYRNYFVFRGSQGAIELKLGEVHQTLAMLKRIMGGSGVVDFGCGSAGKGGSKEGSKVVVRDVRVDEGAVRKLVVAWCACRESSTGFVRCVEGFCKLDRPLWWKLWQSFML